MKIITITGISRDTVRCLRELLALAESGDVVGVSYAAFHKHRRYSTHSCGEAHKNPSIASAFVGSLWFDLQIQARGEKSK
jgi:hypothetical protein